MNFISFLNNPFELVLILTIIVVWIIQIWFYLYHYRGIIKRAASIRNGKTPLSTLQPPVTVIVCARDQADKLELNLPLILGQKYPEFQVVVVNDASTDETEDVLMRFEKSAFNFYHTFIPPGVQNVSARKMAITIGIKAAKYDHLLFIDPDCVPENDEWISGLMSSFDEKCGLVLAYSTFPAEKDFFTKMVLFDNLFSAIQFMGFAVNRKAYMGFSNNMAYKKELFFKNKGFASYLYLNSGEDDLFISEISTSENTKISIEPESKVVAYKENVWKFWKRQRFNRFSTYSYYSFGTKVRLASEVISRCIFYLTFPFMIAYGILAQNLLLIIFSAALFLLRYVVQVLIINKNAKKLKENNYYITLLLFDIILPWVKSFLWFKHLTQRNNDFTRRVLR